MNKCFLILSFIYLAEGQQEVSVHLKQDVTLVCQSSSVENISVLKWSRSDLNSDGYVYFYRNKRCFENYQHPWFHGRVMLRDAGMKGGDASLILKNATFKDAGIYECHLLVRELVESRRSYSEISHVINLTVTDAAEARGNMRDNLIHPEDADGNTQSRDAAAGRSHTVTVIALVAAVAVLVVAGFLTIRSLTRKTKAVLY
ncbi:hypothetical protein CHARACLAT_022172 [Characodon lateralis]|uniref:Ig-like domain-containing protein n=1 Tax=Characodon lateralis TaxID=208331 RepID=A0ABU7CZS7_9TELE|nr:hypothetical protein [Characodon lateralis]